MNPLMHAENVIECYSVYAGPCTCGPSVHINLSQTKQSGILATARLSLDECDEFIRQIRGSMRLVRKAEKRQ